MKRSPIIVLMGPTCSGKDSILRALVTQNNWHGAVSYTTRKPREKEVEGVDYKFITNEDFEQKLNVTKEIFEHTVYNTSAGMLFYGLGKDSFVDDKVNVCVLNHEGIDQLLDSAYADRVMIFSVRASLQVRMDRYLLRDKMTTEQKIALIDRIIQDRRDEDNFNKFQHLKNHKFLRNETGEDFGAALYLVELAVRNFKDKQNG